MVKLANNLHFFSRQNFRKSYPPHRPYKDPRYKCNTGGVSPPVEVTPKSNTKKKTTRSSKDQYSLLFVVKQIFQVLVEV